MIALGLLFLAGGGIFAWNEVGPEAAAENQRQRPASKVNVINPTMDLVTDSVSAVGSLRARDQISLTTELSGRVVELNLNAGSRLSGHRVCSRTTAFPSPGWTTTVSRRLLRVLSA